MRVRSAQQDGEASSDTDTGDNSIRRRCCLISGTWLLLQACKPSDLQSLGHSPCPVSLGSPVGRKGEATQYAHGLERPRDEEGESHPA